MLAFGPPRNCEFPTPTGAFPVLKTEIVWLNLFPYEGTSTLERASSSNRYWLTPWGRWGWFIKRGCKPLRSTGFPQGFLVIQRNSS